VTGPADRRFDGLHVLADDDPRWPIGPVAQARAACRGGAAVVQLRCKHGTDAQTLRLAREIRTLTREAGIPFVVNDRFDLALACDADAVHLGQEDLPPARLPAEARARLAIGRSTHDPSQADDAVRDGVDYVAFGPLFGTTSKTTPFDARGREALAAIARRVAPLPVVAIGGIDADNARVASAAGARGIAVISAVAAASDPVAATQTLVQAFSAPGVHA
jgi:thiamine-phosphate pyrophosphorylase